MKYDIIIPINGAKTINRIMIKTPEGNNSPSLASFIQFTILKPACSGSVTSLKPCAIAAPAKPPINVCDDDDGIPFHHVNKFQIIAAITPARITIKSMLAV